MCTGNAYTDYENTYDSEMQKKSLKAYEDAEKAAQASKSNPVRQKSNTGPSGEIGVQTHPDSVAAYLEYLGLTYPDTIFSLGEFTGDPSLLSGIGGIMLSERLLQKMVDDPEYGLKMEMDIAEIEGEERSFLTMLSTQGTDIFGHGVILDENGMARTWGFTLENLRGMIENESTNAFMQMEELREKAMKLDLERSEGAIGDKEHIHYGI